MRLTAATGAKVGGVLLVCLAALHASVLPSLVVQLSQAGLGATSAGLKASWLMVSVGLAIIGVSAISYRNWDQNSRHLPILHATFAHASWLILLKFLGMSPPTLLAATAALFLSFPLSKRMTAK